MTTQEYMFKTSELDIHPGNKVRVKEPTDEDKQTFLWTTRMSHYVDTVHTVENIIHGAAYLSAFTDHGSGFAFPLTVLEKVDDDTPIDVELPEQYRYPDDIRFEPGDKVRVLRSAESFERNWAQSWAIGDMDEAIGGVFVVQEDHGREGVLLRTQHRSWWYPHFVLEKVDDDTPTGMPEKAQYYELSSSSTATFTWDVDAEAVPIPPGRVADIDETLSYPTRPFEPGTWVRITRAAESDERGWNNSWTEGMDEFVGRTFQVESDNGNRGVELNGCGLYQFPRFVLEQVDEDGYPTRRFASGTRVRVTGRARNHERGWRTVWSSGMDYYIGNVYEVLDDMGKLGVRLEPDGYTFPHFVLEVVDE